MLVTPHGDPLTDDEIERLTDILENLGPSVMSLEMIDGFFCALICGPDLVLPSEYLPMVLGKHSLDNEEQADVMLGLLMRHWNAIASTLLRSLTNDDAYIPMLFESEDGIAHANKWAAGFMRGTNVRADSWQELIQSKEDGWAMVPIMMFAYENHPDPEMRPEPITPAKREEIVQLMISGLHLVYRYFEPERRIGGTPRAKPFLRSNPKVGRNDPCPCGSGKKFKHCCAS